MKSVINKNTGLKIYDTVLSTVNLGINEKLVAFIPDVESPEQIIEFQKNIEFQQYLQRVEDGQNAYLRIQADLRYDKIEGNISEDNFKLFDKSLKLVGNALFMGQWIDAQENLLNLAEIIPLALFDKLSIQFSVYINENY